MILVLAGSRVHHLLPEEGHAGRVRKGGQEEGTHQEPGRPLRIPTKGSCTRCHFEFLSSFFTVLVSVGELGS
jgi:hypothetical protein